MNSRFALGETYHQRLLPTSHGFSYPMYYLCLDVDEVEQVQQALASYSVWPWLRVKPQDYFPQHQGSLRDKALAELAIHQPNYQAKQVVWVAQGRCWGGYFSPVNFALYGDGERFDYLIAEVTNTPWGEKHYYCVELASLAPHDKCFHVSPFNPMDMTYHWQVELSPDHSHIAIHCLRHQKEFVAGVKLSSLAMNQKHFWCVIKKHPLMNISMLKGIYWQAFKLYFIKRVPFYSHPDKNRAGKHEE